MMTTPAKWPLWPYLPVKRPKLEGGWPDFGVIFAEDMDPITEGEVVIYRISVDEMIRVGHENWYKIPQTIYPNAEAAVVDGWVVD